MGYRLKRDKRRHDILYRQKHWLEIRERMRMYYSGVRSWADRLKHKPCADCKGWFEPCQMDWDHVRGNKVSGVSNIRSLKNKRKLLDEIGKCELVCASCHRLRTFKRGQHGSTRDITRGSSLHKLQSNPGADKTGMFKPASL